VDPSPVRDRLVIVAAEPIYANVRYRTGRHGTSLVAKG
jgi:hypothetical protein